MRDYRVEVLRNHIPIGTLLCRSVSIKYDSTAEVMRGMQCEMYADKQNMITADGETFEFDLFTDRIRPILIEDGKEYSLGVFMVISAPKRLSETGSYYDIEAYDETMLLKQGAVTNRTYFGVGTGYIDAVETLLTAVGLANVVTDENTDTMTISHEYEVGATYLQIINSLLAEINFNPVHIGADGYVYLTKKTTPTEADFIYKDRMKFNLIGQIRTDTDIYDKPNVLVGVLSNPQQSPIVYTRENNDPSSALSTVKRGYKVVKVYRMGNVASEATLQEYIDAELLNAMQTTETVEFETLIEGGHEYRTAVQLSTDLIEGLYTETAYQIDIRPNQARMRHTAERRVFI